MLLDQELHEMQRQYSMVIVDESNTPHSNWETYVLRSTGRLVRLVVEPRYNVAFIKQVLVDPNVELIKRKARGEPIHVCEYWVDYCLEHNIQ